MRPSRFESESIRRLVVALLMGAVLAGGTGWAMLLSHSPRRHAGEAGTSTRPIPDRDDGNADDE